MCFIPPLRERECPCKPSPLLLSLQVSLRLVGLVLPAHPRLREEDHRDPDGREEAVKHPGRWREAEPSLLVHHRILNVGVHVEDAPCQDD